MTEAQPADSLLTLEHVGDKGWHIRVCLETMEALIDVVSLGDVLRSINRDDLTSTLDESHLQLQIEGRRWLPELLAKILVLRSARYEHISALYSDLAAARSEAVRAVLARQSETIKRIGLLQDEAMALTEEDLSYRVVDQQEVN